MGKWKYFSTLAAPAAENGQNVLTTPLLGLSCECEVRSTDAGKLNECIFCPLWKLSRRRSAPHTYWETF